MIDLSLIRDVIAIASFGIALTYYILNIQHQRETRKTQLFMQIYEKFNKDDETIRKTLELSMLEFSDYDDFIAKFGIGANPEVYSRLYYQMMYYEGLGLLVKRGLIDIKMVEDFMSGVIISFWGKYGPVFLEYREKEKHPTWAEWTEYLYNQIEPIYRKQHGAEAIDRYKTGKYEIN